MAAGNPSTARVVTAAAVLLVCVAGLNAWWLSSDTYEQREAKRLWDSQEPASYAFDYAHCGGMCAQCTLRITVAAGRVTDVVRRHSTCSDYEVGIAPTIDEVFDLVGGDRAGLFTGSSSARFDPDWGFPSSASMTCGPGTADCGSSYSVSDFEVLAPR